MMISHNTDNKYALIFGNEKITYQELHKLINDNNHNLKVEKILFLTASSDLNFIINFFSALQLKIPVVIFPNDISDESKNSKIKFINNSNLNPKTALILFTSGSSGDSKYVQLSHDNIEANTYAVMQALDFNSIDSQVLFLPLSYSFGLLGQLVPALVLGKTTYIVNHVIEVKKLADSDLIQMISGVPSQHLVLLKLLNKIDSITHIISAGAPLNLKLRKELVSKFKNAVIYNNYGQTELSPRALVLSSKESSFLSMATGRVVDGLEYNITNESELIFKGKQVMLGYLGEEDSKIKDGWLYTGDMAEEKNGIIYIKGRKDSLVKISGQRISLKFLENLISSLEEIHDSAFLCIDSELYGNELYLFYESTMDCHDKIIEKYTNESGLKVLPKKILKLKSIPKNTNGKTDYLELKKIL